MTSPDEWVQAAQAADQEYARLPLSQRDERSWQRVPDRQVARLLEAAAPLIAAAEHTECERLRDELIPYNLPPGCPNCGCRTSDEADARDCGCDTGCNDGPDAPGVNVLVLRARAAERDRIRQLAIKHEANGWIDPATYHDLVPFADLLAGDQP